MRICQLTGKQAQSGNNVSHSNAKSKRRFNVNLQKKRFFIPEEDKWIELRVSAAAIRNINKNGISACIKTAKEKGFI
jgi:large subunit ribosomal protein L28